MQRQWMHRCGNGCPHSIANRLLGCFPKVDGVGGTCNPWRLMHCLWKVCVICVAPQGHTTLFGNPKNSMIASPCWSLFFCFLLSPHTHIHAHSTFHWWLKTMSIDQAWSILYIKIWIWWSMNSVTAVAVPPPTTTLASTSTHPSRSRK